MTQLTSSSNPKIKLIRALRQRKARDESGLFVVEGIRHVGEAVAAGAAVEYLCYSLDRLTSDFAHALIRQQSERGIPCYAVASDVFEGLAEKDNPQGILAVVRQKPVSLADLTPKNLPWGVALVAPQDPGNIGTILRTVDAVGASGLLLLNDEENHRFSADPYHPSAVRASMGALFSLPLAIATFDEFAGWAKRQNYHIYGTSAHGSLPHDALGRYERPAVLLMGSEQEGLTTEQQTVCHAADPPADARAGHLPQSGSCNGGNVIRDVSEISP